MKSEIKKIKKPTFLEMDSQAAQQLQKRNKEAFDKSYFGKKLKNQQMAKNNHTPDRQITPDDDKPMKPCNDCNGCGEIIEWDDDDMPEPVTCPTCKGLGEYENEDDEW